MRTKIELVLKMNIYFLVISVCLISQLFAAETSLSALQALKETSRPELLSALAEIHGKDGAPQPSEWIMLCNDPNAHGGVRELTIANGHLVSERTPMGEFVGKGDLPHLSVTPNMIDSAAVFKIVDQEAKAAHIGFDSINYTLRVDAISGKPLWSAQIYKSSGDLVGTMEIDAETGKVLKSLDLLHNSTAAVNCCVAPVFPASHEMKLGVEVEVTATSSPKFLSSTSTGNLNCREATAPETPCTSLASASSTRSLLPKNK